MTVRLNPITAFIGAEVDGVDLTQPLTEETFRELHRGLLDHLVLVFRDQTIGPREQLALAKHFGTIGTYDGFAFHPEAPEVQIVQNNSRRSDNNASWHMDSTFLEHPPAITLLHCVATPSVGGDTLFSSLYEPYNCLPESMKTFLGQLSATHDRAAAHVLDLRSAEGTDKLLRTREKYPPVAHPLVFTHPASKRKALFVDGSYTHSINGMPWSLGHDLLKALQTHTQMVEFQMRVRWRVNTLVIFDNRVCQHYASMDFMFARSDEPVDRRMHRVTVHAHPGL